MEDLTAESSISRTSKQCSQGKEIQEWLDAIKLGDARTIKKTMPFYSENVIKKALVIAVQKGQNVVDLLLSSINMREIPFDINAVDKKEGQTLLMMATEKGHTSVTELLLQCRADPDKKNDRNETALMISARKGYVDMTELLLKYKAKPDNKNDFGDTPLIIAAKAGHADIVELLLKYGADPDKKADISALIWAVREGHESVVNFVGLQCRS